MCAETREALFTDEMVGKFRGLLAVFSLGTLFLTLLLHGGKFYEARTVGVELFLLRDGGIYPLLFWVGQVLLGTVAPLLLLAFMNSGLGGRRQLGLASLLFLIGGMAQIYVVIIGAQAVPLDIFPGYEMSSAFADGAFNSYAPTLAEALLGLGGLSLAMLLTALAFRLLPFLPQGVRAKRSLWHEPHLRLGHFQILRQDHALRRPRRGFVGAGHAGAALQEGAGLHRPDVAREGAADARATISTSTPRRPRKSSRSAPARPVDADLALMEGNKGLHDGVDTLGRIRARRWPSCWARPWSSWSTHGDGARRRADAARLQGSSTRKSSIAGDASSTRSAARGRNRNCAGHRDLHRLKIIGAVRRTRDLAVQRAPSRPDHARGGRGRRPFDRPRPRRGAAGINLEALLRAPGGREISGAAALARLPRPMSPSPWPATRLSASITPTISTRSRRPARGVVFRRLARTEPSELRRAADRRRFPETRPPPCPPTQSLREDIRAALAGGLPCYAECGGMMYLSRSITFQGETHAMVGALPADAVMGDSAAGQGTGARRTDAAIPLARRRGGRRRVAAHEFHYARMEVVDPGLRYAWKVKRGHGIDGFRDGMVVGNASRVSPICAKPRGCAGPRISSASSARGSVRNLARNQRERYCAPEHERRACRRAPI